MDYRHFSRPYGTEFLYRPPPGVETPGYYQASLQDAPGTDLNVDIGSVPGVKTI
jgi:hypothetical protein